MRIICYFNGRSRLGGAERRVGRVLNLLNQQNDFSVTLLFRLYEPLEDIRKAYEAVIENCSLEMIGFKKDTEIYGYVKKAKPDAVLYTGGYGASLSFALAGHFYAKKSVHLAVTTSTSMLQFIHLKEKILFYLETYLASHVDCLYPQAAPILQKEFPHQKVSVTPVPFIPLHMFQPQNKNKVIAFISRWDKIKNPELFIDAVCLIRDEMLANGYTAVLGGNAKEESETKRIRSYVAEKGMQDLVATPGYLKPQDYLPGAEVFCSLQDVTNYPSQSLLEAIASGCYIVATDFGDTGLLVKNEFGKLVPKDASAVADALRQYILLSDEEKTEIAAQAHGFAMDTFTADTSVNYYAELLGEKTR